MVLSLHKPQSSDEQAFMAMMLEWQAFGGRIHPGILKLEQRDFTQWLQWIDAESHWETCRPDRVPQDLFLLKDETGKLYGGCSLRPVLNQFMAEYGGHVAYGIRPSERRQGYGTIQLRLLLAQCKLRGLSAVLVTCSKDNLASQGVITTCGGIYERDVLGEDGELRERYWIIPEA